MKRHGCLFVLCLFCLFFLEIFTSPARFAYTEFVFKGGCSLFLTNKKQTQSDGKCAFHYCLMMTGLLREHVTGNRWNSSFAIGSRSKRKIKGTGKADVCLCWWQDLISFYLV